MLPQGARQRTENAMLIDHRGQLTPVGRGVLAFSRRNSSGDVSAMVSADGADFGLSELVAEDSSPVCESPGNATKDVAPAPWRPGKLVEAAESALVGKLNQTKWAQFINAFRKREEEHKAPRMLISYGCAMSTSVLSLAKRIMQDGAGLAIASTQAELLKPHKNRYFDDFAGWFASSSDTAGAGEGDVDDEDEADTVEADVAAQQTSLEAAFPNMTKKERHRAESRTMGWAMKAILARAVSNGSLEPGSQLRSPGVLVFKGDMSKLRPPLVDSLSSMDTRAVAVMRCNALDHLVCAVRDCFVGRVGHPVTANGTQTSACFDRRQLKADEQPKAWLNATLAVRSVKGQMVKRRKRLMQRLESGSWPAGRKWAGDRRFRFSNKSESVFCAEELMAFGGNASVEAFELSVQRWSQLMRMLRVDMDVHALRDVLSAGRGMHPLEPHVNTIANYEEVQAAFEPAGLSQLLRTAPKAAPGVPMGDAGAVLSPLSREGSEVPDIFTCPALDELVPCAAERYRGNLSLPCTACLPGPGVKTKFVASVSQPPVKLDKPLYLMVAVPPFWGSTALTGLLSTSPAIATMCSNTSWACESTESLVKSGILHKWSVWARSGTNWSDVYDFYNRSGTWSNDSRPIRLDKNPPNIAKTRELLDFFEKRGMDYRFIVAARHPCLHQTGRTKQLPDGRRAHHEYLREVVANVPAERRFLLSYTDMVTRPGFVAERLLRWLPQLQSLDTNASNVYTRDKHGSGHGRDEGLLEYMQSKHCSIRLQQPTYRPSETLPFAWPADSSRHAKQWQKLSERGVQVRAPRQPVRFIHVPKTGGVSLLSQLDATGDAVSGADINAGSGRYEQCLDLLYTPGAFHMVMLREPRGHVFSQFLECRFDPSWGTTMTRYTGFPWSGTVTHDFEAWLDHFGTNWTAKSGDFNCYNPWNMQARILTCVEDDQHAARERPERLDALPKTSHAHHVFDDALASTKPNTTVALTHMYATQFVGITELYQESWCLLQYMLHGKLPDEGCGCGRKAATAWISMRATVKKHAGREGEVHEDHSVPIHNVTALPASVLAKMDAITEVDQHVFRSAALRLIQQVQKVEAETGRRLLCPERMRADPKLREGLGPYFGEIMERIAPSPNLDADSRVLTVPINDAPGASPLDTSPERPVGSGPDHYTRLQQWLLLAGEGRVLPIGLGSGEEPAWAAIQAMERAAISGSAQDSSRQSTEQDEERAGLSELDEGKQALAPFIRMLSNASLGYRAFVWSAVELRLYKEGHEAANMVGRDGKATFPSHWFNGMMGDDEELSAEAQRRLTVISFETLSHNAAPACPLLRNDSRANHAMAVPYPTSYHATTDAAFDAHVAWVRASPRDQLAVYYGGIHGMAEGLRTRIHKVCTGSERCSTLNDHGSFNGSSAALTNSAVHGALRNTTFCLEPAGDTPTRSQIFDCLLSGGIPVFFASCAVADLVYERMYEPFLPRYDRTRFGAGKWAVLLDIKQVMHNDTYMMDELAAIAKNATLVAEMREQVIKIMPRIQYRQLGWALDRYQPDALAIYMDELQRRKITDDTPLDAVPLSDHLEAEKAAGSHITEQTAERVLASPHVLVSSAQALQPNTAGL